MTGPARRAGAPPPAAASAVPDVLAPDLASSSAGSTRVASPTRRRRTSPTRATTSGGCSHAAGFTSRLYEPREQFDAAGRGHRHDERRAADDARLRRPAARRLRGRRRAARAARRRAAAAAWIALRRQGGLPRRVQRAARARPAGAAARRDAALRAALDLTGERGRAMGRAAALVPRAREWLGLPSREPPRGARARPGRPTAARALRLPRRYPLGAAGRRGRRGRERRAGAAPGAARRSSASRLRARPAALAPRARIRVVGSGFDGQRERCYLVRVERFDAGAADRPRGRARDGRALVDGRGAPSDTSRRFRPAEPFRSCVARPARRPWAPPPEP